MNKVLFTLALLVIPALLFSQAEKKIIILHTNDLHSRLNGFAPESDYSPLSVGDDKTTGGFARISSIIRNEKEKNSGITLVVDAGDFLMGTLFHHLEPATGFQLPLMRKMGFDVVAIGNHEFDFGPGKLAEIINTSRQKGDIPSILLGNAVLSEDEPEDDALEELYVNGVISRKSVLERDGLKIGFFSVLGKVADHDAPYAVPVTFEKQIVAAKRLAGELKKEGCDIIVCLSHSGLGKNEKGEWAGEDIDLAKKVKDIDIIISGHTHTRLDIPLEVNGVKIVQTGDYGRYVGKMELTLRNENLSMDNYSLIAVDDMIRGDEDTHKLIENQKREVNRRVLEPLGYDYNLSVAETDIELTGDEYGDLEESNLGPLVADAIRYYINSRTGQGTDISMVAVGVIRDRIVKGKLTAPDIFRVMSLGSGNDDVPGYPFSQLWVTGRELKTILEILLVASRSNPSYYCYYSGIRVGYDPARGLLRKIQSIEVTRPDGTVKNVSFSRKDTELYSLSANSYMLEFIGIIKRMSFGLLNVVPKNADGSKVTEMKNMVIDIDEKLDGTQEGKEWIALIEYLKSMDDVTGNGIPDIDRKYSGPVRTFSVANN